jgi:3-oxoacyl-[acyl-carrier protein] reductase
MAWISEMLLDEQVAWVTGASRGIGKAVAIALATEGAKVVVCGRSLESLQKTVEEIRLLNQQEAFPVSYDVTDLQEIKSAALQIRKEFKTLDILVNNAGILDDALLGMVSSQQLMTTMSTNLNAVIYHMQFGSRMMSRQKAGSIINMSSIIARVGNEGQVVYGASKAGVIGATLSAAKELAPLNIRVNAIAPGFIDTDMTQTLSEEKFQERLDSIKMKRIGQPEEVASVTLFLASSMASYVTGQVIGVDGGMLV